MIVESLDLNDLLALPARGQHGALFPVVDIDTFLVEFLVKASTEVTDLLIFTTVVTSRILLILIVGRFRLGLGVLLLVVKLLIVMMRLRFLLGRTSLSR